MKISGEVNYELLSELSDGFSGAEIKLAVIEAGYIALRENRKYVTLNDLVRGIEKVKSKKDLRDSWQQVYETRKPVSIFQ
jgi:Proteasome-activating nucleotidase